MNKEQRLVSALAYLKGAIAALRPLENDYVSMRVVLVELSKCERNVRECKNFIESKKVREPSARAEYRQKCKHYVEPCGQCSAASLSAGKWSIDRRCNGICRRMKLWDRKNNCTGIEFKVM